MTIRSGYAERSTVSRFTQTDIGRLYPHTRGGYANVVTAIGEAGVRPATAADMRAVAHREPDISADTGPSVDDATLIARSWRDPERFTVLFDRYYAEIHGYVARRLGPSRAEDVASETFL